MITACFDAYAERRPVASADLQRAVANMVPLAVTQAEKIMAVRDWARLRAVAATAASDRATYAAEPESVSPARTAPEVADYRRGGRMVDF